MNDNISPEERLLKLIKGAGKQKTSRLKAENSPDLKPLTQEIITKTSAPNLTQSIISSENIHKVTLALFGAAIIYLLVSLAYPFFGLKKIRIPAVSSEKAESREIISKSEPASLDFYLQGTNKRKIFSNPTAAASAAQDTAIPTPAQAGELIKDIALVGIISGDNPQAVIEDKKTEKTYYVAKGQFIGEIQITDIQESKIIADYKGKKFEFYL